jgi:hypothetical protein
LSLHDCMFLNKMMPSMIAAIKQSMDSKGLGSECERIVARFHKLNGDGDSVDGLVRWLIRSLGNIPQARALRSEAESRYNAIVKAASVPVQNACGSTAADGTISDK